jgi:hypothetical protein
MLESPVGDGRGSGVIVPVSHPATFFFKSRDADADADADAGADLVTRKNKFNLKSIYGVEAKRKRRARSKGKAKR